MTSTSQLQLSPDLTFGLAENRSELAAIRRFRKSTYRRRSGLVIADSLESDRRSLVFGLYRAARPVATLRLLPLPDAVASINDFAGSVADPTFGAQMELGRLAVDRDESPMLLLELVRRAALWLGENSEFTNYVSFCNAKLCGGYEMLGAVDQGVDVTHPESNRRYRIMTGRFQDVLPGGAEAVPDAA